MLRHTITTLCLTALLSTLGGCGTMLQGSHQIVHFDSEPQGADVWVEGEYAGKTPCDFPVPRKDWDKNVRFTLEGHKDVEFVLKNDPAAAGASNAFLLWLAPIGILVDSITGGAGAYQPIVRVKLERDESWVSSTSKTPY